MHPLRQAALLVVGMHIVEPAKTDRRSAGAPGEFIKSVADVVAGSVRLPAEDDVRSGLHNGIEFLVLARKFAIQLLQCLRPLFQFLGSLRDPLLQVRDSRPPVDAFLRCNSANTLTFARNSSGITGTEI